MKKKLLNSKKKKGDKGEKGEKAFFRKLFRSCKVSSNNIKNPNNSKENIKIKIKNYCKMIENNKKNNIIDESNIICKNNICIDKRLIKYKEIIRKTNGLNPYFKKNLYFFFNIDTNKIYKTNTIETFKNYSNNKGIIFYLDIHYIIYSPEDIKIWENRNTKMFEHKINFPPMITFLKEYDNKEIKNMKKNMPPMGLSKENTFDFTIRGVDKNMKPIGDLFKQTFEKSDGLTESDLKFESPSNDISYELVDKAEQYMTNFILNNIPIMKNINKIEPYIGKYKDILHNFYTKCSLVNKDFFNIIQYA